MSKASEPLVKIRDTLCNIVCGKWPMSHIFHNRVIADVVNELQNELHI